MDRTTSTSNLHSDPPLDVPAPSRLQCFPTTMLHILYMPEKMQLDAHAIRESQRSVDAAPSDLVVVGHRLASIAQLALGVCVIGNSTRPVENLCDLFEGVALCLGENEVGDCQEDDQEATDCELSVGRPHTGVLTHIQRPLTDDVIPPADVLEPDGVHESGDDEGAVDGQKLARKALRSAKWSVGPPSKTFTPLKHTLAKTEGSQSSKTSAAGCSRCRNGRKM